MQKNFIKGIKDGAPIMLGNLSVSFACGILTASSLPWFVPIIFSSTQHLESIISFSFELILSLKKYGLTTVALSAVAVVYFTEILLLF